MEINNFFYNFLNGNSTLEYIDVLGYRIYIDDLLLIVLIFFLYKEGVEDNLLLMCLISLLFSWNFIIYCLNSILY